MKKFLLVYFLFHIASMKAQASLSDGKFNVRVAFDNSNYSVVVSDALELYESCAHHLQSNDLKQTSAISVVVGPKSVAQSVAPLEDWYGIANICLRVGSLAINQELPLKANAPFVVGAMNDDLFLFRTNGFVDPMTECRSFVEVHGLVRVHNIVVSKNLERPQQIQSSAGLSDPEVICAKTLGVLGEQ